jgi:V-type H+-transporting ATPase subunit a
MLWRACRGNVFLRVAEIEDPLEDPHSGDEVIKSVFVIFFQGEQLKSRVKKICEGFRATMYPCPDQATDRREMAVGVMQRLEDLNTVLGQTNDHRHRVLAAAAKNIKIWFVKVRKIKAIYHTLNFFNLDTSQKCLIAECWIPRLDMETIQLALRRGTESSGSTIAPILNEMQTTESPPTFFRTNKFTIAFQELINAYGVATYREMNPAVFTIITFPFLFAIMFGDIGHGTICFLTAFWCIIKEKQLIARKIDNEIWNYFFNGRYLVALMGIFSIYTGLIYNDIFSKSVNIFGSSWQVTLSASEIVQHKSYMLDPSSNIPNGTERGYYGSPYPFGIDPIWQVSSNKIVFLNSFKMKIAIILGVIHMLFGLFVSFLNSKYFGKTVNILCEFVPQVIFLCCMFGYMSMLMLHKWTSYTAGGIEPGDFLSSEQCAPSVLISFINMVLFKTNDEPNPGCDPYMYWGQKHIQRFMMVVALSCIPWMLLAKPLMLKKQAASKPNEFFDFGEVMMLQGIHTIEYALGTVSHTASYLRLWALSLAHAQLSEVLWSMVLQIGLKVTHWYGGIILWAMFGAWAGLTVMILCLMEGLSAFLHTLRLHWVEFQSKFYGGQGYIFTPFSFEKILELAEITIE